MAIEGGIYQRLVQLQQLADEDSDEPGPEAETATGAGADGRH